jgi:prepilin-type N-terminal cleavage/methylation domain-containing protein
LHAFARRSAFTLTELLCVVVIAGVLLTLVCPLTRRLRRQGRIAVAQSRLRQVATVLDIHFGQNLCYPRDGTELLAVLDSSLGRSVCRNPLRDESVPGQDLAALYRPRTLAELDRPGIYLTSFPDATAGAAMVVLETGGRVTQRVCPGYAEGHTQLSQWIDFLYPQPIVTDGDAADTPPEEPDAADPLPEDESSTVSYVVVRDAPNTIKFEDAPLGLGEDGVQMTDVFAIELDGAPQRVTVTTKAATSACETDLDLSQPGDSATDAIGFRIAFVGREGNVCRFEISAAGNRHALSHVTFDFGTCPVATPAGHLDVPRITPDS